MKLSVVILNYNVRFFLEQCLLSVKNAITSLEAEIIVIDNNSTDDSCEMVRQHFPEVILIENQENVGFSKANNQAVKVAKGEYVCIINPDTAVQEDTFVEVINYADSIKNMGALGVYLMDGTGNFLPESKRNLPTPKISLLKLTGFTEKYYANHVFDSTNAPVEVLVGAFMLLKREVYNEVGGFDEDYFMYGEDIDLSYKITKAGYQNHYFGSATVLHYKGESTQRDEAYFERFYGAMQIFYKKHFDTNFLFDRSVSAGLAFAKKTRKLSENKKRKSVADVQKHYIITENIDLVEKMMERLAVPLQMASKNVHSQVEVENCFLIFDAEYISYSEIFRIMKQLKNKGNIFRIRPAGCNYIIGSDQSDEKGGVLLF